MNNRKLTGIVLTKTEPENLMLKIRNLSAYYGSVRALSGVTMHVREGEIVTLIGANGAGKTTLLNAICGLVRKDGDLAFAGRSLMGLAPEEIVGLGHLPGPRRPPALRAHDRGGEPGAGGVPPLPQRVQGRHPC